MYQSFEIPAPPTSGLPEAKAGKLVFTTLTFPYSKGIHTFSLPRCLERGESVNKQHIGTNMKYFCVLSAESGGEWC